MKKTIAISAAMLLCVAIAMTGISFAQQKQWTKPQTDDVNISVNSPVEDVQQQYKGYKWDYIYNMPDSDMSAENWSPLNIEMSEELIDFNEAGYIACEMMDNTFPELGVDNITFYGRLRTVPSFRPQVMAYSFINYEPIDENNSLYRSCEIEIHSGKCVQAVAGNKELWAIHKYEPYVKYPSLTSEDTDRILSFSADICSKFGYSGFESYRITENPGNSPAQYWVYIYTANAELLRVSLAYTKGKIYFQDFCNEKLLGYGMDITELPNEMPKDIAEKYPADNAVKYSFEELSTVKTENGYVALHICSMEHTDCAAFAVELGIDIAEEGKTQHCPFGNIISEAITEKLLHSTTTCTHNAVGKTDNTYIIRTYNKHTCTGCAYNTTANYKEEMVTVCG
ncbi:MAG: hypothetical protein IJN69_08915 [Oscillospiraceae bacterium]|nr:hypothetical protein [Oscillospiraceae bacterium]